MGGCKDYYQKRRVSRPAHKRSKGHKTGQPYYWSSSMVAISIMGSWAKITAKLSTDTFAVRGKMR